VIKKKNISESDINDWKEYIKNPKDIYDKDLTKKSISKNIRYRFDLHGYTLNEANLKVKDIIRHCLENNFKELLLITGKGLHSKPEDIYTSKDSTKLKYSIPSFLDESQEIFKNISSISKADEADGGEGALIIKLKLL
jgi:DNA-nicking Smr family endonuclease